MQWVEKGAKFVHGAIGVRADETAVETPVPDDALNFQDEDDAPPHELVDSDDEDVPVEPLTDAADDDDSDEDVAYGNQELQTTASLTPIHGVHGAIGVRADETAVETPSEEDEPRPELVDSDDEGVPPEPCESDHDEADDNEVTGDEPLEEIL